MKSHRLSASRDIDVVDGCLVPLRIDVDLLPDPKRQPAMDGDAVHLLAEKLVCGAPIAVNEACAKTGGNPERVARLWENLYGWLSDLPLLDSWNAELFLLYDPRTDRCRATSHEGRGGERGPWEIPAIADLAIQDAPNHATVWDIKTGKPSNTKVSQRVTLALATSRWFRVDHVSSGFLFVDEYDVHPEPARYAPQDLASHAAYLESLLLYLPEATPQPGASCRYCLVKQCDEGAAYRARMGWTRKSA